MQKSSIVSPREKNILWSFLGAGFLVLCIFLLLGFLQNGLPGPVAQTNQVQLAVLCPSRGTQVELCAGVVSAVRRAVESGVVMLPEGLQAAVVTYDTGGTADGAASAALSAAQNPNTAVIIGPLDARQVQAAAEVLQPYDLALITPASTALVLKVEDYPNLYRMPASDLYQGQAIVDFLDEMRLRDVFVIAERSAFVPELLNAFNNASQGRLRAVGSQALQDAGSIASAVSQIKTSQAQALVFLGSAANATALLQALAVEKIALPLVGTDALNTNTLQPLPENSGPVYFTSPIVNLAGLPDESRRDYFSQKLGDAVYAPFAFESAEAAWMVLTVLSSKGSGQTPRQQIVRLLANGVESSQGSGHFTSGQFSSAMIHVYQVGIGITDWKSNRLVFSSTPR